jgi:hypothetical protein
LFTGTWLVSWIQKHFNSLQTDNKVPRTQQNQTTNDNKTHDFLAHNTKCTQSTTTHKKAHHRRNNTSELSSFEVEGEEVEEVVFLF